MCCLQHVQLLELCDKKVVNVGQVKSCLLMSVAISIQQARVTNVLSEQVKQIAVCLCLMSHLEYLFARNASFFLSKPLAFFLHHDNKLCFLARHVICISLIDSADQ